MPEYGVYTPQYETYTATWNGKRADVYRCRECWAHSVQRHENNGFVRFGHPFYHTPDCSLAQLLGDALVMPVEIIK